MKSNVIDFFRRATPFLAVIALWRFAYPVWNPAGVLALIPIFYYTFVRPINGFALFGALFCFLVDYNMNLAFFWTAMYCIVYAANGFQNYFDVTIAPMRGIGIFALWFGVACFILAVDGATWGGVLSSIWIFMWTTALYLPITRITRGVQND